MLSNQLIFISTFQVRFEKKLPTDAVEIGVSEILMALLRMRLDSSSQDLHGPFHKFLLRLFHRWCQRAESSMEKHLLEQCPDPTVAGRVHPFLKSARMRGNKAFELSLCHRFAARGSGFISMKDSPTLAKLGIVSTKSTLASKTSSEFATRTLVKTAELMMDHSQQSKILNFCFDAAFVAEEQAPWFKYADKDNCNTLLHKEINAGSEHTFSRLLLSIRYKSTKDVVQDYVVFISALLQVGEYNSSIWLLNRNI